MRDRAVEALLERLLRTGLDVGGASVDAGDVDALRELYRSSGWEAFWRERLARMEDTATRAYVEPYRFVEIHVRLGDHDAAFAALETALQRRSSWIPTIPMDPALDPLRDDPRLADLLTRAGLH
jgi:hypothetical protein